MAACVGCREDVEDDQESVRVPSEFGGGIMHQDCWDAVVLTARFVIRSTVDGGDSHG